MLMIEKRIGNALKNLSLIFFTLIIFIDCGTDSYKNNDWQIIFKNRASEFSIKHSVLKEVVSNLRIGLSKDGNFRKFTDWSIIKESDGFQIITSIPDSSVWKITVSDSSIRINSSIRNSLFKASVPITQTRTPARTSSAYNGIIYNFFGPVTFKKMKSFYDHEADCLIDFPNDSKFMNSDADMTILDITCPVNGSAVIKIKNDYYGSLTKKTVNDQYSYNHKNTPVIWYFSPEAENLIIESEFIETLEFLKKYLQPFGLRYIQIDEKYLKSLNEQSIMLKGTVFPRGAEWVVDKIREYGFLPSVRVTITAAERDES